MHFRRQNYAFDALKKGDNKFDSLKNTHSEEINSNRL